MGKKLPAELIMLFVIVVFTLTPDSRFFNSVPVAHVFR